MASGVLDKGTTLAGYRIDGILGQGGMGVVYEATQLSLDRVVALKVLASHLTEDITFIQRFQREGQIQAKIDHPNIVTVFDSGKTDEGFFIAMRLVRGPNLKDMIVSRELDPGRTMRILTPVADALDTAHQAGLIHRDIKPQNVLVGGRDQAYLADFGLTKATGDKSLTKTGQFVGTLDYISPEQIKGDHATTASDVYALAAVLYECLTGVVPFPKDSEAAVLYAHMADPPPEVTKERPDLPGQLDEVLVEGDGQGPRQALRQPQRAAPRHQPRVQPPHARGVHAARPDRGAARRRASARPRWTCPPARRPPRSRDGGPGRDPRHARPRPARPRSRRSPRRPAWARRRPQEPARDGRGRSRRRDRRVRRRDPGVSAARRRCHPGRPAYRRARRSVTPGETKVTPQETRTAAAVAAETKAGAAAEAPSAPRETVPPAERKGTPPLLIGAGVGAAGAGDRRLPHRGLGRRRGAPSPSGGRAVTAGALELSTPEELARELQAGSSPRARTSRAAPPRSRPGAELRPGHALAPASPRHRAGAAARRAARQPRRARPPRTTP